MSALAVAALIAGNAALAQPTPAAAVAGSPAAGLGDVNLSPRRLVLDGRARAGEITVINRGSGAADYRVELSDLAMTSAGTLTSLDKVDAATRARHRSAVGQLRYSPRRVSLRPGQSQVIRVLARASDAPGESRAHLSVSISPPPGAGLEVAQAVNPNARAVRVQITPIFGISIPIIVRSGAVGPASVSIEAPRVVRQGDKAELQLTLQRSGERSVYGDVEVFGPGSSADKPTGLLRGVAVYPEIDRRSVAVTLAGPRRPPPSGDYRIVFRDAEVENGKVLAEAHLQVP